MFFMRAAKVFHPSGMLKSGTQSLSPATGYTQVTGWAADAAYPGSSVSSNALVLQSSGATTLSAAVAWSSSLSGAGTVEIYQNGSLVITGSAAASGTTGTATAAGAVTGAAGDLITVYFFYSVYTPVTVAVSGTFCRST